MKTIQEYLGELAEIHGSYYAVAKQLKITQQSISIIRKGGGIKDETAIKIAELLNIDEEEVLLAAAVGRSSGKAKTAWENISKKAGIAATFLITVSALSLFPDNAQATQHVATKNLLFANNIHYAKSIVRFP